MNLNNQLFDITNKRLLCRGVNTKMKKLDDSRCGNMHLLTSKNFTKKYKQGYILEFKCV